MDYSIRRAVVLMVGAVSLVGLALPPAAAETITWDGSAGDGLWNTAANWDLNRVPTAGDAVVIPDLPGTSAVTFSAGTTSINSLTCDEPFVISGGVLNVEGDSIISATVTHTGGATLGGAGTLTVNGLYSWSHGTMSGSGVTQLNGGMLLSGPDYKSHYRAALNNANNGTVTWTGTGDFYQGSASVINNPAGSTFDIQNDRSLVFGGVGDSATTFNNAGTLRKSAGSGTTTVASATFNNTGMVEVQTGILALASDGVSSGSWTIANGAVLNFSAAARLSTDR